MLKREKSKRKYCPQNNRKASNRFLGLYYEEGSKCFLIGQHWFRMREALTFNRERILHLCNSLQVTPQELAMMVRQHPGMGLKWIAGVKVNPSVELHLLMLERAALGAISPMADQPLFPTGIIGNEEDTRKKE
jgi:hypothetical protein